MTVKYMGAGPTTHRARGQSQFTLLPFQTTGLITLGGRQPVVRLDTFITPPSGGVGLTGQ